MGEEGEKELVYILGKNGLNSIHRLKQDSITRTAPWNKERLEYWLRKNRELPREKLTFEVDVFSWKDGHWGALAIEQKNQRTNNKTLTINHELSLFSNQAEIKEAAGKLFLQCCGAGCLGNAYCQVSGLDKTVLPLGVVDYNISLFGTSSKWGFYRGVFFVRRTFFPEFLEEFLKKRGWVRRVAEKNPFSRELIPVKTQ